MIFSELYSAYYNTVAKILKASICQQLDKNSLFKIVQDNAFEESVLNVVPAIKEQRWQLITKDFKTPVKHLPTMPLTTLQKRWLKAILADERIKLFDVKVDGLDDIEPLFTKDDYCIFDKYADGDNFGDDEYIQKFRLVLYATRNKLPLRVETTNRKGKRMFLKFIPQKREYSAKDEKFRVYAGGNRFAKTINVARIKKCELYEGDCQFELNQKVLELATITMMVKDERNALERTMLHFAHFEKQVEKIDDKNYKVVIKYDVDDQSEMVIRVLSFGPLVEVVQPDDFRQLIKQKLKKQQSCEQK